MRFHVEQRRAGMGLGAQPGVERLDIGAQFAHRLCHLIDDAGPVLSDQRELQCLARSLALLAPALPRRRDAHLQPLGVDGGHGGAQGRHLVLRQLDQNRADIEPAQPREMALQPVAAGRQHGRRQRLGEARPVAAGNAQDQ